MKLFWSVVTVAAADTCRCGNSELNTVSGSAQWIPCANHKPKTRDSEREVARSSRHRSKHAFDKTLHDEIEELPDGTCENSNGCFMTYFNHGIEFGCIDALTYCDGDRTVCCRGQNCNDYDYDVDRNVDYLYENMDEIIEFPSYDQYMDETFRANPRKKQEDLYLARLLLEPKDKYLNEDYGLEYDMPERGLLGRDIKLYNNLDDQLGRDNVDYLYDNLDEIMRFTEQHESDKAAFASKNAHDEIDEIELDLARLLLGAKDEDY